MFEQIVDAIKKSVRPETVFLREKEYATREQLFLPPTEREVKTLNLSTLTGIVAFLNKDVDLLSAEQLFLHVEDSDQVDLYGFAPADGFGQRHRYLTSLFQGNKFPYGSWINQEQFILNLHTMFVRDMDDDLNELLETVSNVVASAEVESGDDGISQQVQTKKKVTVSRTTLKNPITLTPMRTFHEITQPSSPFAFRVRKREENEVEFCLAEADNSAWKREAKDAIATWLGVRTSGVAIIT